MIKTYSTLGHLAANSFHLERHIGPSPEENFLVSIGRSLPEEEVDIIDIIDNLDIIDIIDIFVDICLRMM